MKPNEGNLAPFISIYTPKLELPISCQIIKLFKQLLSSLIIKKIVIIYNAKKDIDGILVMSGPGPRFDWAFANIGVRDATRRRVIGCIRLCGASPALLAWEGRRAVLSWGPRGWKITRTLTCTDSSCACHQYLCATFPSRGSHMPDRRGCWKQESIESHSSHLLWMRVKFNNLRTRSSLSRIRKSLIIIYI